jgi:hypothetical protein
MQVLPSTVKSLNISSYTERFFDSFPDKETTQKDYDNFDFQRVLRSFSTPARFGTEAFRFRQRKSSVALQCCRYRREAACTRSEKVNK